MKCKMANHNRCSDVRASVLMKPRFFIKPIFRHNGRMNVTFLFFFIVFNFFIAMGGGIAILKLTQIKRTVLFFFHYYFVEV